MKPITAIILLVMAFILWCIAVDVGAIRNEVAPEKSAIEKVFETYIHTNSEKEGSGK